MAHFAQIDENNQVVNVVVVNDDDAVDGQNFLANVVGLGGTWIQTSYNTFGGVHLNGGTPLRKNFAGIGFTYNPELDAFIEPKPNNNFVLNHETCLWEAPFPKPDDGKAYIWDDTLVQWIEVEPLTITEE